MGVYYCFYNVTYDERNKFPIPGNGNCVWAAKLDSFPETEIKEIFISVIKANSWCISDAVGAYPDTPGYPSITYLDGMLNFEDHSEEEFSSDNESSSDESSFSSEDDN